MLYSILYVLQLIVAIDLYLALYHWLTRHKTQQLVVWKESKAQVGRRTNTLHVTLSLTHQQYQALHQLHILRVNGSCLFLSNSKQCTHNRQSAFACQKALWREFNPGLQRHSIWCTSHRCCNILYSHCKTKMLTYNRIDHLCTVHLVQSCDYSRTLHT